MDCDFNKIKDGYIATLKKWNQFDGRTRRQEFWMFVLCNLVIGFVAGIVLNIIPCIGQIASILLSIAMTVASVAVGVRRLHDTGRDWQWILLALIPCVGLVLIYFFALEGDKGDNKFGPDPKAAVPVETPPAA